MKFDVFVSKATDLCSMVSFKAAQKIHQIVDLLCYCRLVKAVSESVSTTDTTECYIWAENLKCYNTYNIYRKYVYGFALTNDSVKEGNLSLYASSDS